MSVERRAGAPRLIDWTGERCVPWTPDVQVAYEHYHRYLWAAELVAGRRVLDLGSGEGFGSAILAGTAASVLGIEIDAASVDHAKLNYAAPSLEFRAGSALDLEELEEGGFGAVVAFEIIEHLREHEQLLDGIRRVLAPDGLLVMSTPERRMYTDASGQQNPFHERELVQEEFAALLDARFAHVSMWGQRTITGSRLSMLDGERGTARGPDFALERAGDEWRVAGEPTPMYLIAVASQEPGELPGPESYLADFGLELLHAAHDETREFGSRLAGAEAEGARLAGELGAARDDIGSLLAQFAERERSLREAVDAVAREQEDAAEDRARLRTIEESVTWRLFERVRTRFYGSVGGRVSAPGRLMQWSLRAAGRRLVPSPESQALAQPALRPIRLPAVDRPRVTIIIPVHARADLTEKCLRSIAEWTDGPAFEVIVVDDRAPGHEAVWAALENVQVIHNEENLGYLRSNNLAAAQARGEYLLLLNNDTEVLEGWLEALVARADGAPEIGIVVPKLLFMDGTLQEAGGIVFSDGSGWNFGRGRDPDGPEFNYMREVDYGSAACLLVRAEVWRELGGFDERYLPMYYEDTDLCFAAREAGHSVVYEPRAAVHHVEGATAGTDTDSGGKRFQELNRAKFTEKWASRLAADQLPASPWAVRRASDRNRGPHVLVIDHRVPSPDRDSGSVRMWELLKALLELGCRVTFLPDNHLRWEPYSDGLQSMGVEVLYSPFSVPAEIAAIGARMKLAIVSRPQVAGRYLHFIREFSPNAKIVFDTVDLHYVREQRRAELDGSAVATAAATWREIELALVRVTDVTAVVSEPEREEILRQVPGTDVIVLPNANAVAASVAPPADRAGLLFVGSFEHLPNVDAVVWLVDTIMPLVWGELGDVKVTIVGAEPQPEVLALAGPGVEIAGWVEDLQPLLDSSRVMVAPLRYGAGMKGKVTQSLAAGLPVVTTTIGAEGLGAEDGREMLIADEPGEFAERIALVYGDDALWRELSAAGQGLVERTCSPATLRERLRLLLGDADH